MVHVRSQFRKILDEVYGIQTLVIWNCSYEHVQDIAEHVFKIKNEIALFPDDDGGTFECTVSGNIPTYVVWLAKRDYSSVVHECVHLVSSIFKNRGIRFSSDNDEHVAYYMAFWADAIMKKRERKKKGANGS